MTRRFLALGDSYTIGEGVSAAERWPAQLVAVARSAGMALGDPQIIARTGWTTSELLAALEAVSPPPRRDFDLVSLLIGVNDQYRAHGSGAFRDGFSVLLSCAIGFAGGMAQRVVAISIPDWGVTPFAATDPRGREAIGAEIDEFNAAAQGAARQAGAAFVDVTTVSRRAAHDRTLLAADGLHPSAAMYADWATVILPIALRALGA